MIYESNIFASFLVDFYLYTSCGLSQTYNNVDYLFCLKEASM